MLFDSVRSLRAVEVHASVAAHDDGAIWDGVAHAGTVMGRRSVSIDQTQGLRDELAKVFR